MAYVCFHLSLSLSPLAVLSSFPIRPSLSLSLSLSLTVSCLFGWQSLFVYCFQMADADFICVAFKFPRELFTALAQALILFPLAWLYDGPLYLATGNDCHKQSGLSRKSSLLSLSGSLSLFGSLSALSHLSRRPISQEDVSLVEVHCVIPSPIVQSCQESL